MKNHIIVCSACPNVLILLIPPSGAMVTRMWDTKSELQENQCSLFADSCKKYYRLVYWTNVMFILK